MFQDTRTNEIYSAGVLITLKEERAKEIVSNLGNGFIEIVPEDEGQIKDFVQVAVDEATAPLLDEIKRLKAELTEKESIKADNIDEGFPKMISRGKYELSNGETFEGNKEAAFEAEKALEK